MSRRIDFTLTEEQLAQLEQTINASPYPEVRQRAIAVRMLHLGRDITRVQDTPLAGEPDMAVLDWAAEQGYIYLT